MGADDGANDDAHSHAMENKNGNHKILVQSF